MKLRNLKWSVVILAGTLSVISCSEDYLEVSPTGSTLEANYYKNEAEAYSGVVSVYDIMKKWSGGFENMMSMLNAGSDDFYAGGGNASDGA
ncbi:MAG: RagB/SusD family nutrient uptake outer membrane protein, partial [Bacteroidota bacterium]